MDKKHGTEPAAGVSLRPDDPFAKKLPSTGVRSQNILIKVTLPKRTGRKRKRGSNEPYVESSTGENDTGTTTATDLVRRVRDNADRYTIEPMGIISNTHRFQTLPDFQVRAAEVPIMRELREHAILPDYERLKSFNISASSLSDGIASFPGPPSFMPTGNTQNAPRPERWRNEKPNREENIVNLMSGPTPPRLSDLALPINAQEVPQAPPKRLPEATSPPVQKAIDALGRLLEERPIVTRRVYLAKLQGHQEASIRWAVPYVGYYFSHGPWRHAVVRYGVDPRKDPKCRIYQTLSYSHKALETSRSTLTLRKKAEASFVFDGKTTMDPASPWQLCDLTDVTLQSLVDTDDIRAKCDSNAWGWYRNGTVAKICVILRDKMLRLAKQEPKVAEERYEILANLPNDVTTAVQCYLDSEQYGRHTSSLAEAIGDEAMTGTVTKFRGYEVMVVVPVDTGQTPEVGDGKVASEEGQVSDENGMQAGLEVDENGIGQALEEVEPGGNIPDGAVDAMQEEAQGWNEAEAAQPNDMPDELVSADN